MLDENLDWQEHIRAIEKTLQKILVYSTSQVFTK